MFDWESEITIREPGSTFTRKVCPTNFFGRVYFTYLDELLAQQLGYKPGEKVLDVGGGTRPFKFATTTTDPYIDDGMHRSGVIISHAERYVKCFAEKLPFGDREFDLVIARHVLEHVRDPAAACHEMMRVARRGYIESPSYFNAYLSDYPAHSWIVHVRDGRLVFERRRYLFNPYRNCFRSQYYADADLRFNMNFAYRNIVCTQFYWEDAFKFEIIDDPAKTYDYGNPEQAALSHLDFALNDIRFGGIPIDEVLAEIDTAIRLNPRLGIAHYSRGVVLALKGRLDDAESSLRLGYELDPGLSALQGADGSLAIPDLNPTGAPQDSNLLGPLYLPVPGFEDRLARQLGLGGGQRILDIAVEALPLAIATETYREPYSNTVPYPDHAFDVVICRESPMWVEDPGKLVQELGRVALRGLIELPSELWSYFIGHPAHRWVASWDGQILSFRPCHITSPPFGAALPALIDRFPELAARFELHFRNITYIQVPFQGTVPLVVEARTGPSCDEKLKILPACLEFAATSLQYGMVERAQGFLRMAQGLSSIKSPPKMME